VHNGPSTSDETTGILFSLNQAGPVTKTKESLMREKEDLRVSLNNIIDSITSMEEVEVLKKMIAPIAPTLTAVRQKNSQIKIKARKILIPHNKKIEPQRRLFSTKKKKRCTSRLRKPNAEETEKIAISAIVNSQRKISQKQMYMYICIKNSLNILISSGCVCC
jgi:hypothetical protein